MKVRWTALTTIIGYAVTIGALALLAPSDALARKSAAERLAENTYAALTAEG